MPCKFGPFYSCPIYDSSTPLSHAAHAPLSHACQLTRHGSHNPRLSEVADTLICRRSYVISLNMVAMHDDEVMPWGMNMDGRKGPLFPAKVSWRWWRRNGGEVHGQTVDFSEHAGVAYGIWARFGADFIIMSDQAWPSGEPPKFFFSLYQLNWPRVLLSPLILKLIWIGVEVKIVKFIFIKNIFWTRRARTTISVMTQSSVNR